jgi:hypothetical protein
MKVPASGLSNRPPEKKGAPLWRAALKTDDFPAEYRSLATRQVFTWVRWEKEAVRLFAEFWRSGDRRHLEAFSKHVWEMRVHVKGGRYERDLQ